eukprot:1153395-Pelagomonas_calceolata.AAC.4
MAPRASGPGSNAGSTSLPCVSTAAHGRIALRRWFSSCARPVHSNPARPPSTAVKIVDASWANAQGGDTGRVMVVLITDGRANISLARSNEDPDALKPDAPKPTQEQLKVRATSGGLDRKPSWFKQIVGLRPSQPKSSLRPVAEVAGPVLLRFDSLRSNKGRAT